MTQSNELDAALLGIAGNDYESLWSIREVHWGDDPLPTVQEMIRALRELQRKGWIQCFRLDESPAGFLPIDTFEDSEAEDPKQLTTEASLWWLTTKSGLEALQALEADEHD